MSRGPPLLPPTAEDMSSRLFARGAAPGLDGMYQGGMGELGEQNEDEAGVLRGGFNLTGGAYPQDYYLVFFSLVSSGSGLKSHQCWLSMWS